MGRAGGWILILVVVVGMAAAGAVGFRSILFRKKVTIRIYDSTQWTPQRESGIRLAFEERGFRAGSLRVEPDFVNELTRETNPLHLRFTEPYWMALRQDPDSDPGTLHLSPQGYLVGKQAARWARRSGIQRVFLLRSSAFEMGFESEAKAAGIECRSELTASQGRSLVEVVLAADPQLVILDRLIPIVGALRKAGYSGRFLGFDEDFDPSHYRGTNSEVLGALLAASFTPVPADFVAKHPAAADQAGYYGYRMASLLFDAIERADTDDPAAIYRTLSSSPEFSADGTSTLPGALYVFRENALEFVEPLK